MEVHGEEGGLRRQPSDSLRRLGLVTVGDGSLLLGIERVLRGRDEDLLGIGVEDSIRLVHVLVAPTAADSTNQDDAHDPHHAQQNADAAAYVAVSHRTNIFFHNDVILTQNKGDGATLPGTEGHKCEMHTAEEGAVTVAESPWAALRSTHVHDAHRTDVLLGVLRVHGSGRGHRAAAVRTVLHALAISKVVRSSEPREDADTAGLVVRVLRHGRDMFAIAAREAKDFACEGTEGLTDGATTVVSLDRLLGMHGGVVVDAHRADARGKNGAGHGSNDVRVCVAVATLRRHLLVR